MEEHKVLQRLVEVSTSDHHDQDKIEAIDRDISCAINTIQKIYLSPFSPQIKQARLSRCFYKLHLSMIRNKLDLQRQLDSLILVLDDKLPAPSTLIEAKQLLCDAQKTVRSITKKAEEIRITSTLKNKQAHSKKPTLKKQHASNRGLLRLKKSSACTSNCTAISSPKVAAASIIL
jgi:hypothetical protein